MSNSLLSTRVELSDNGYEIIIGSEILKRCGQFIAKLNVGQSCAVLSDANVAPLYASMVCQSLNAEGIETTLITVESGEASKSMVNTEDVCRQMIRESHDRHSFVVALGGGVVGDLSGFISAIFYRGIPLIQIPTTVVSQVDSAIGGKTGVNTPEGKNHIGCFHQPRLVIADTSTLETLPEREFNEGFAEVIKHAAIRDADMFEDIMNVEGPYQLNSLIAKNVAIKARIVEEDEKELNGVRAYLNYGHTIGHAIEAAGGYGNFLHGEAISLGLIAAGQISSELFGLPAEQRERIRAALVKFKLPTKLSTDITTESIINIMGTDKKFEQGQIRFVALHELGRPELSDQVSESLIANAIECLR